MFWSLIAIISLIQLASGVNGLLPDVFEDAKRAKNCRSNSPAGGSNDAVKILGCENQEAPELNHMMPDLDQSHVRRVFESNKNGPYFWENELFKSNTHVGWQTIDQMKTKRGQAGIKTQVDLIQVECSRMRTGLDSYEELKRIVNPYKLQNAYEELDQFLEKLTNILTGLFYPRNLEDHAPKDRVILPIFRFPDITLWNIVLIWIHDNINELENILLRYDSFHYSFGKLQTLITQAFRIFNFLIKNNLIQEDVLEKMIRNEKIEYLVSNHIIEIFSKEIFFGLNFRECLLESKSTEHLVFVLKFLQEDFFKNVEYKCLRRKINSMVKDSHKTLMWEACKTALMFQEYDFGNDVETRMGVKVYIIERIITSFNASGFSEKPLMNFHTYGILYDMLCFALKYYPEIVRFILGNEEAFQLLSIKMNISDSAMRWLKSAVEIKFVGERGFWTSDLYSFHSENQIALEEAKDWSPVIDEELDYFKKNFKCYILNDFDYWERTFRNNSMKRSQYSYQFSECVNSGSEYKGRILSFGTNFNLKRLSTYPPNIPLKISSTFISDLYSWIHRMKLLLDKNIENWKIWIKLVGGIASSKETTASEAFKDVVKNSAFLSTVMWEIKESVVVAQSEWEKIKGYIELLNKTILSSIYSSNSKISEETCSGMIPISQEPIHMKFMSKNKENGLLIQESISETNRGIIIPEIQFNELLGFLEAPFSK